MEANDRNKNIAQIQIDCKKTNLLLILKDFKGTLEYTQLHQGNKKHIQNKLVSNKVKSCS